LIANKLFGNSNPQGIIDASRSSAFAESQDYFKSLGQTVTSWDDIDSLAVQEGYVTDPASVLQSLETGQLLYHQSKYDTPDRPWYSIESLQSVENIEQDYRNSGHWAFTGELKNALNEMATANVFGKSWMATVNPSGDTSVYELYSYAESLADSRLSYAERREAIYDKMRSSFSDDQTLDSKGVGLAELVTASGGACRHLSGLLFNAYNLAGVSTDFAFSDRHTWVQSSNEDGTVVTIDPNMVYNYHEFAGPRSGSYAYHYDATYTTPDGTTGTYVTPTGNVVAVQPPGAIANDETYCSLLGYCVDGAVVTKDTKNIFEFEMPNKNGTITVAFFENDYLRIENLPATKKENATLDVLGAQAKGVLFEQDILGTKVNFFVGELGPGEFMAISQAIGPAVAVAPPEVPHPATRKPGSSGNGLLLPAILAVAVVLALLAVFVFARRRRKKSAPVQAVQPPA
jgi:hypothetical protein